MGNASVGGSKDVSNFMGCMDTNQMPDIASLTYEGLYYDYFFKTKNNDEKENHNHLIHPTYSCAKTRIPHAITMLQSTKLIQNNDPDFSNEELTNIFQNFKQIDTDNDGFITKDELINSNVFKNYSLSTNAVDTFIDDTNKLFDFSEFVKCIKASKSTEQSENNNNQRKDAFEYYMTIGLNSSIDSNNLKRNKINLVICLDNSGSMSSTFNNTDTASNTKRELPPQCPICNKFIKTRVSGVNSFDALVGEHMDSNCIKLVVDDEEQMQLEHLQKTERKCVMDIANESVISLLQQLNDDDRFGLVVFSDKCSVYQPLKDIKDINMDKLKTDVLNIKPCGGTDMELAYNSVTGLYDDFFKKESEAKQDEDYVKIVYPTPIDNAEEGNILDEYWNRIIFITDALPNTGKTDAHSIMNLIQRNSDGKKGNGEYDEDAMKHIYTTFIGVGLDMNASLMNEITKVRGCNYYSVHSNEEFMQKMTEEFKFMVTPIAFDFKLSLKTEGNGMCIDDVYGSGDDDKNKDKEYGFEVMNVSTLFPSPYNESKEIKGGIVLLKLKTNVNHEIAHNMDLDVSYKEVSTGKIYSDKQSIVFGDRHKYENEIDDSDHFDHVGVRKAVLLTRYIQLLKQWMQHDQKDDKSKNVLYVSRRFKNIFAQFVKYFKEEMKHIDDPVLEKEVILMQKLVDC